VNEARATIEVINKRGLHARASAKFVNLVATLPETLAICVSKDGTQAEGGSILGLMMLGAARGDSVEIVVRGDDADAALAKLAELVQGGFGED
jgi:phosphocarrier protein HPr